jgi:hypothetical protein
MSNTQIATASSVDLKDLKSKYLELISNGYTENVALKQLNFPKALYLKLLMEDLDFIQDVEAARKLRADFWVSKIAESLDKPMEKDEVPVERLKFDKLQFLAKADNPDKYGNNSKKMDINIDLGQFKLLPPEEALKAIKADPFAIEAEYTDVRINNVDTDKDIL